MTYLSMLLINSRRSIYLYSVQNIYVVVLHHHATSRVRQEAKPCDRYGVLQNAPWSWVWMNYQKQHRVCIWVQHFLAAFTAAGDCSFLNKLSVNGY